MAAFMIAAVHNWPACTPPKCEARLTRTQLNRYRLQMYMDGRLIREGIWKSKSKITDELNKAGERNLRGIPWPQLVDHTEIIKIQRPARWFWE